MRGPHSPSGGQLPSPHSLVVTEGEHGNLHWSPCEPDVAKSEKERNFQCHCCIGNCGADCKPAYHVSFGCLSSLFSAKRVRRALTMGRKNSVAWIVDTGANIVVVPTADPAIIRTLPSTSQLRTAHGIVQVQHALIKTPVGECKGVVSAGSPRLMPDIVLKQKGWDYRRYGKHAFLVSSADSSRRVRIQTEAGCPIITNERLFLPSVKETCGGSASAISDPGAIAGGAAVEGSAGCGLRFQACVGVSTPPAVGIAQGPIILGARNMNVCSGGAPALPKKRNRRSISSRIAHDRIHGTRAFRWQAQPDKENGGERGGGEVQATPAAAHPRRPVVRVPPGPGDDVWSELFNDDPPSPVPEGDAWPVRLDEPAADAEPAPAHAPPPEDSPVVDLSQGSDSPVVDLLRGSDSGSDTDIQTPVDTVPLRRKSAQKHRMPMQDAHERAGHRGLVDAVLHCPACEQSKIVVADARPARSPEQMVTEDASVRILIDYEGAMLTPGLDGGQYSLVVRLYEKAEGGSVTTATFAMACRSRQHNECIRKVHDFRTIMHLANGSHSIHWMLHGDNEGAWTSHGMGVYLRAENGQLGTSVAYATHAKTAHEAAVRSAKETRNAGLLASGAPERFWPLAQETTLLLSMVHERPGFTPGLNLAISELRIPFGGLGVVHLNKEVYNDPLKRGTVVCFLKYRLDQVFGGRDMFFDRFRKTYRQTNISLGDVTWDTDGRYGWLRDAQGNSISQFGPDMEGRAATTIEHDMSEFIELGEMLIECERCGKWRWWTAALKESYKELRGLEVPEDFFCEMIPRHTCDTPEPHFDQEETWIEGDSRAHTGVHTPQFANAVLRELELTEKSPLVRKPEHYDICTPVEERSEADADENTERTEGAHETVATGPESEAVPGDEIVKKMRCKRRKQRPSGRDRKDRVKFKGALLLTDGRHFSLRKLISRMPVSRERAWVEHEHVCDRCRRRFAHNHPYGHVHRELFCSSCKNSRRAWRDEHVRKRHRSRAMTVRACAARPISVSPKDYHGMCDKLQEELKGALLHDSNWLEEFRRTESSCMDEEELCVLDDDALLARHATLLSANVARPLKKGEKQHPMAAAARTSELKKIFADYNTFDKPRSPAQAKGLPDSQRDTAGRVAMIEVMKHSERQIDDPKNPPKFKARLVFLGNRIWRLHDHESVQPTGADVGLYGSVTTLESFRSVVAYAGLNEYEAETTDLTAAYLQAPWPKVKAGRCYAKFTENDLKEAPAESRKLAQEVAAKEGCKVDDLLWEMQRCLYGHPISGHAWITHFTAFLTRRGWVECHTPGLFRFKSLLLCVYVDDLCIAGAKCDLDEFWNALDFVHDGREPLTAYLGVRVKTEQHNGFRIVRFDMKDYCKQIDDAFLSLFDEKRADGKRKYSSQAQSRVPCSSEESITPGEQSDPQRRVQKLLGMLLWLHRCTRPDIGFALSRLGSRVTTWNEECNVALARLVSYLRVTSELDLHFRFRKGDTVQFLSHSDASLVSPRSQSGTASFIIGGQSYAMIGWGSQKQKVAADSSAWAEIVAVHSLVRGTMGLYLDWDRLLVGPPEKSADKEIWEVYQPMTILIDNSTALKIVYEGFSSNMIAAHVMLRLRSNLLRDAWQQGLINVGHVRTDANIADGFTKYLSKEKLDVFRVMCGLVFKHTEMQTEFDRIMGVDTSRLDAVVEGEPSAVE